MSQSNLNTELIENETFEFDAQGSGLRDVSLLQKLWPFMKPYWRELLVSVLLLPVVSFTQILQPMIVRHAIDGPMTHNNPALLIRYSIGFLALLIFHYWIRYIQLDMSQVAGQKIVKDIRTTLYAHLQGLSMRFFHLHPVGKLVTRVTSDVENLSEMLSSGGIAILTDITLIVGAVGGMVWMDVRLAGLGTGMLVLSLVILDICRRKARHAYNDVRVKTARINAFLQENITGMELVQLYRRETHNTKGFGVLNQGLYKSNMESSMYNLAFNALVELMTYLTMIIVLWYAGRSILKGTMTFGLMVAFLQYVQFMFEPVESVSEKVSIIQAGLASIDKVMILFNQKLDLVSKPDAQALPALSGRLDFDHVTFAYVAGKPVLNDVSFSVEPGQTLALVGPSGAGKTTIFKLLTRFYDVGASDGRILVDGHDVRDVSLNDLRRQIISIQQDDIVFSRSIAENIALSGESFDETRVWAALDRVHARAIVERLPGGIREVLTERGRNLSAGERQLLLFARAVYHNPAVLILDEATSAVDPNTEALIQDAMEALMTGRTVLMIAHRLSTIQKADRILVMDRGRILESGSHTELVFQNGMYSRFYQYQQMIRVVGSVG